MVEVPTVSMTRAALAALVIVAAMAVPVGLSLWIGDPFWLSALVGTTALFFVSLPLGMVLAKVLRLDVHPVAPPPDDPPASVAPGSHRPGPDEPVYFIDWDDRGDGCTLTVPHEPHHWCWRADMPVRDGVTRPAFGSLWCRGVPPQ